MEAAWPSRSAREYCRFMLEMEDCTMSPVAAIETGDPRADRDVLVSFLGPQAGEVAIHIQGLEVLQLIAVRVRQLADDDIAPGGHAGRPAAPAGPDLDPAGDFL